MTTTQPPPSPTPEAPVTELKRLLSEATPRPWMVVRSEAHKRDGTICGQTEVKYFVTTEALRREGDWLLETHDKELAALIVAAVNGVESLLVELEALRAANALLVEERDGLRKVAVIVADATIAGGRAFDETKLYEAWRLVVKLGIKRSDEL